jgi:hypothetical protein
MKDFQQLFTPTLKGEVAENQAPFRVRGKTDFQQLQNLILFGLKVYEYTVDCRPPMDRGRLWTVDSSP